MNYSWEGEPIEDIHAWAAERGERVVRVRHTWTEPRPMAGRFVDREEILEMPESFARCMRFGGGRNDQYEIEAA